MGCCGPPQGQQLCFGLFVSIIMMESSIAFCFHRKCFRGHIFSVMTPGQSINLLTYVNTHVLGFPSGSAIKNPPANAGDVGFYPWDRKIPWRRAWQPTPVFLLWKSHGQMSLAGYSPGGHRRVGRDLETKQQQLHIWCLYNIHFHPSI